MTGISVIDTTRLTMIEMMYACPKGAKRRPSMPDRANKGTNTSTMIIVA